MTVPFYQIDAFTSELYKGNPAAVCLLDAWLPDETLQAIAAENNLSETAFVLQTPDGFSIRWFTPLAEVELCGHATLAAAHVLFTHVIPDHREVAFASRFSGVLTVFRKGDELTMDFPADEPFRVDALEGLYEAMGICLRPVFKGKTDYLIRFNSEAEVRAVSPDMRALAELEARGVICTAPGKEVDFVSRFFAPAVGVDEDPVTGSAHTVLTPYWAQELGKSKMTARQVSTRGGDLSVELKGERVLISGEAVEVIEGKLRLR